MSTKDALLAAACKHFGEGGYNGTALAVIAQSCGIKTPSIYAFFKNKDHLYLEAFRHVLKSHYAFLKTRMEAAEDWPAEDRLYSVIRGLVDFHEQEVEMTSFFKQAYLVPPHHLKAKMNDMFCEHEKLLTDLLTNLFHRLMEEGAIAKRDIQALLAAFFCLMDGVFLEMFYYSKEEFHNRLQMIWPVFWDGLKNSNQGSEAMWKRE
ncbi:MAG: TetR/AcrR family transcriptional regulator [Alicyclobacillus sp.]|nr:TetR/AcrR family transcriptional regulator [Alicyclobacillus sp.]